MLDTRRLQISLPNHKAIAWSSQIRKTLSRKSINLKDLKSILGRLENLATIMKMFGNFLNNIRALQIKLNKLKGHNALIPQRVKMDLELALQFIKKANSGLSLNTLVFRKPSRIYIVDACKHGFGGWCADGSAWCLVIPKHLRNRAHINLLEFMAHVIPIWMDIMEGRISNQDCVLVKGDSWTTSGWLRRSNFRETDESTVDWMAKQEVGRKLANLVLEAEAV